jgi:ribonuclease-3
MPATGRRGDERLRDSFDRATAMSPPLQSLQDRLCYRFVSEGLLRQALTHRSHGATHNERLEFLGDSVLNCAVASLLYERFDSLDEGDLSRVRANLVKQQTLFEIAQRLDLSACLLLGEGEQRSGGFRRPSILADTLEAVFGAIFIDGGFDAAQQVIRRQYEAVLLNVDPHTLGKDAKTLLQEWLQSRKIPLPVYSVVATHGAAHNQLFEVECAVPKLSIQVLGGGGSRRAAEQAAAKLALEQAQLLMPGSVRPPRRRAPAVREADPMVRAAKGEAADPERSAPEADAPGVQGRRQVHAA